MVAVSALGQRTPMALATRCRRDRGRGGDRRLLVTRPGPRPDHPGRPSGSVEPVEPDEPVDEPVPADDELEPAEPEPQPADDEPEPVEPVTS